MYRTFKPVAVEFTYNQRNFKTVVSSDTYSEDDENSDYVYTKRAVEFWRGDERQRICEWKLSEIDLRNFKVSGSSVDRLFM